MVHCCTHAENAVECVRHTLNPPPWRRHCAPRAPKAFYAHHAIKKAPNEADRLKTAEKYCCGKPKSKDELFEKLKKK